MADEKIFPLIIWERTDGGISWTAVAPKAQKPKESDQQFLARVAAKVKKSNPDLTKATRLDDCLSADLPLNHFRNSWRRKGTENKIQVDMPLARTQRMAEIRAERNKRIDESDKELNRVNEIGTQTEIDNLKTKRQILRDIPNNIETEGTLTAITISEELAAFEPDWPHDDIEKVKL